MIHFGCEVVEEIWDCMKACGCIKKNSLPEASIALCKDCSEKLQITIIEKDNIIHLVKTKHR